MEKYVKTRLLRVADFKNNIELSTHPDLTLEILLERPDFPWCFHTMMFLPQFNIEWVANFPSVYWNWNELSKFMSFDEIKLHKNFPWNWCIVAQRLSLKTMMEHPDIPWDFGRFFLKKITPKDVSFFRFYKDRIPAWKWTYFARILTWDAFRESVDLPWINDIDKISSEETFIHDDIWLLEMYKQDCNWIDLTIYVHIDIINDNPNLPWRRDYLSWNRSTWKTEITPIEISIREWVAANTIKRAWKRSVTDPQFKICKNRLFREFKEMETG